MRVPDVPVLRHLWEPEAGLSADEEGARRRAQHPREEQAINQEPGWDLWTWIVDWMDLTTRQGTEQSAFSGFNQSWQAGLALSKNE